jgi:hypothetical protein
VGNDNDPVRTVMVNQQQAPVGPVIQWSVLQSPKLRAVAGTFFTWWTAEVSYPFQSLGQVTLTSRTTLRVELSDKANGFVIADAVRFVPSVPVPDTVLVDCTQPGYADTGDGWATHQRNGGKAVRRVAGAGTGGNQAVWQVPRLEPGTYTVQATWLAGDDHARNARYRIYDGTTFAKEVSVNQQTSPSGSKKDDVPFQTLATVPIHSRTLRVVLSDDADGAVIAEAIWVVIVNKN